MISKKNDLKKYNKDIDDNNSKNEAVNGNRQILAVMYFFIVIFIGLIVYITVFSYKDAGEVINSSFNKRLDILSNHVNRGKILARDESVIAETIIDSEGNSKRIYPYGPLFSHVAGYAVKGGLGIENGCAYTLLTSNDYIFSRIANDVIGKKNEGDSIITTLDPQITYAAYEAMGDNKGAVVVSNVKTGEILTILSKPDFDPNTISDYWDYYNNDESNILLNRATLGLYPPGSTFKIVTALEYLRESGLDYADYSYDCSGSFTKDGVTINCYHKRSHGNVDFELSFAKSCNSSFANITSKLNKTKFRNTCSDMLFNENIPSPFSFKKSNVSINSKSEIDELLQTGIGQGQTLVTPYHMNLITSSIANKGLLMTPYVVKKVVNIKGNIVSETNEKQYKRLLTEAESEKLTTLMEAVITEGTGRRLGNDSGYTAAGKTGSAEYSKDKTKSHAWFTGFAPSDDPEIAVTVIVEGGGSGGETAVPIARAVFDTYFNR